MSNVVNLNKFRKKQARKAKEKQAESNRIEHGRPKSENDAARSENERARKAHEEKQLDKGDKKPDDN